MSEIVIDSFGEQTLDALLEAEGTKESKNISKNSRTVNLRSKKSSFVPLQEISENYVLNYKKKRNTTFVPKSCTEKLTNNDDTNIDKYFQDSIPFSNINTQDLHNKIDHRDNDIYSNKNNDNTTSIKRPIGSDKISDNKRARNLKKKSSSNVSKSNKSTASTKSRKDCIKLSEESFVIESSQDENIKGQLLVSKRTESAARESGNKKNTSNGRSLASVIDSQENRANNYREKKDGGKINSSSSSSFDKIHTLENVASKRKVSNEFKEIHSDTAASNTRSSTNLGNSINSITCTQDRCKLASWGLPQDILKKYQSRGMKTMFPWQVECLSNYQVLEESKNLVYSAPTSAGKTLVAEMLIIKTVLERQKKVIFILPFVSVVREKMFYFQDLLSSSGIRVEGFMGGIAPAGGLAAAHIAIATIEKANSLINRLMEEGDLQTLGAVVIDELHLLGDPHRGYLLELLLTKLKYMTLREEHVKIQLIGMSATLPNLPLLAEWLDAELFHTEFRPVPLNEQYKIRTTIYNSKFTPVRELNPSSQLLNDSDNILQLCIETIADGHSTLIFCATKNWCEKLAHQVAGAFFKLGSGETAIGRILRKEISPNAIEETLSQLKRCPAGLDDILKNTVSFGVGFHHAGLTMDERDIIEGSFRTGSLRVLIATSTLSSGVNLPARRVIIRSLMFHGKVIDTLTYRQMIGRAGRMGKDTAGESILICRPNEKNAVESLLSAPLDPVESCLEGSGPLIRALLEAVASEVACTSSEISLYSRCTLAFFSPKNNVEIHTTEAMKFLTSNELIISQKAEEKEQRWMATALGKACLASSVSPSDGLFLFDELQRARKCFVLETELHLIYLVTPFNSGSINGQIDWMIFLDLWKSLSESERRVGKMVGIEERFIMSAMRGCIKFGKQQNIHKRFFTALALHDLVREIPLTTVSEKYGCSRGVLQSLQQSASTFAGMVTQFCKQLGWDCMELLFSQFQARLQFGVCRELLDLLRLPMLNGLRARSLYKEGIKCVSDLAIADEHSVERALHKALPFESEKEQDGEHMLDAAKRNKIRSIFVTGRDGLTPYQAAVMLVKEARILVQHELGVRDVNWKQDNETSSRTSGTKSYDKSSSSFSRDSNLHDVNNQSIGSVTSHGGSSTSSKKDPISLGPENERGINDRSKPKNDSENAILRSENSTNASNVAITEQRANKTKIDVNIAGAVSMERIDSEKDHGGINLNYDIKKKSKNSNKSTKHKPKFDLLGAKRKIQRTENITESIPNDDLKEIVDQPIILSSLKMSGGTLTFIEDLHRTNDDKKAENKVSNVNLDVTVNDNVPRKSLIGIGKDYPDTNIEKPTSSKEATVDLKLSISPVVTLEWFSSFNENLPNNNKSSNDPIKYQKPEAITKQLKPQFALNNGADVSLSRSPSLFGDSFYLDSQFCNELEQNVNGSLGIDKINEPEVSEIIRSSADLKKSVIALEKRAINSDSENKSSSKTDTGRNHIVTQNREQQCPDLNNQIVNSEDINFSWNSTTWDELKELNVYNGVQNKTVKEMINGGEVLQRGNINDELNWGNTNSGRVETPDQIQLNDSDISNEIEVTPMMQNSRFKSISSKSNIQTVRSKGLVDESDCRKRKFNEIHSMSDSSPVLNVLNISNNRRLSFGSNKSDSDDIIVASQNLEPIKNTGKNRSRFKLESSKGIAINKIQSNLTLAESRKQSNIVKSRNIELLRTGDVSAKKVVYQENCSTDSVVSNSEEDSPVRRMRVTQSLHKRTLNSSFIVQNIENLRKCKKRCLRPDIDDEKRSITENNLDWNILDIVNVTWNDKIFNLFSSELKQKNEIAIALACDKYVHDTVGIGSKLVIGSANEKKTKFNKNESCIYSGTIVNGIAISWGRNVIYYISFENRKEGSISLKDRLQLVRDILSNPSFNVRCYGSKEIYKKLHQCCSITCNCRFLDPSVAEWLLHPDTNERGLNDMANMYFPQGITVLQYANSMQFAAGTSSENKQFLLGRHRAAAEAAVTWHVMGKLIKKLRSRSETLFDAFKDVETKVESTLSRMELTGIGINLESLQELSEVLQEELSFLEKRAYSLAGRKFSFTSSKEVAQVLGMYKGVKVSTNKAVLENCDNPISNLVISWRKLKATQTKMVFPLLNLAQQGSRVRGCCVTRTTTGRISMHEPNLQNVPRDFNSESNSFVISMRMAFVPNWGNIMLSADYCQLELRILAHFSRDPVLCEIMKKDSDIFKNIASQWNRITVDEVTDTIRQRTKQLCYGIIYGMGSKTLAKQLTVTELEASEFMETFMKSYPNINTWLNQVIAQSREDGYVTTLMERRRLLPGLNSESKSERSQAERQAVNTKIQGSAADLAKKAMVLIDERLQEEYPDSPRVLSETKTRRLRSSRDLQTRGAYLVLQLHDELLYEVSAMDLDRVAAIVKISMEEAYKLTIPLPVKIKVGPTWGSLTEYKI